VVEVSGGVLVFWWCCDLRGMGSRESEGTCFVTYLVSWGAGSSSVRNDVKETFPWLSPSSCFPLYRPHSPLRNANIVGQRCERMQCHSQVPCPRLRSCRRKK